jgi:TRAP-type transport system small permease protein
MYQGILARAAQARNAIDNLSYALIVALTAVMTAVIIAQVGLRYIFNSSIDWADEAARLSFVWLVFLAVPHGVKKGMHVGLDQVIRRLPETPRRAIFFFTQLVLTAFLLVAGWQAAALAVRNWGNELPTMPLPSGLYFAALAIGCFHSLLHLIGNREAERQPLGGGAGSI